MELKDALKMTDEELDESVESVNLLIDEINQLSDEERERLVEMLKRREPKRLDIKKYVVICISLTVITILGIIIMGT